MRGGERCAEGWEAGVRGDGGLPRGMRRRERVGVRVPGCDEGVRGGNVLERDGDGGVEVRRRGGVSGRDADELRGVRV